MTKLANYDKYKYDYKTYWSGREYEHEAEVYALKKLFSDVQGKRMIDLGGSYGRLLDIYYSHFDSVVIVDYSYDTLKKYQKEITERFPNVTLVAANAYKLPFKAGSFDGGIMFRTIHHIEDIETLFNELSQIFIDKSIFILEFANKFHIKAVIKWLLQLDFRNFDLTPYQQKHKDTASGSKEETVFLNFAPRYIRFKLLENLFKISKSQCVSFLRVSWLKKNLSLGILLTFEKLLQASPINSLNISPSIIYKAQAVNPGNEQFIDSNFEDILACPECKSEISIDGNTASCKSCKKKFVQKAGVWDFRIS
ncbi:class I SAM-dependent methyltransferase [Candidatus Nomurabacteria bacterium]|nr:class I SAM-dependent methyltransferase [Candidatus Nomurabacteria bacterium]